MTDHPPETTPLGDARLIPITDFTDLVLMDRAGGKLGAIKEAYVDKLSGRIEFIIAATGGFLGVGDKFHPIPFGVLSYNHKPEGYVGAFTKKDLEDAPAYDRDQLGGRQYGWSDSVRRYFDQLTVRPAGVPR
ncbi:MAG: PRC-barrel domain-containing protein [Caulobacteraceae bacterium]|nr:PRC-barrel domain-containing protein [Caulobacter sp.]